jgi:hypothetical protein
MAGASRPDNIAQAVREVGRAAACNQNRIYLAPTFDHAALESTANYGFYLC